jgi:hypothetical protein
MWFLVSVVKGSKYFESDSQTNNQIIVSDTTDMIIAGYSAGADTYRFEMRKGNECFVLQDLPKGLAKTAVIHKFQELATQLGARSLASPAY